MSQAAPEGDAENPKAPVGECKEKGALKPVADTTPKERVAGIFACTSVGTSVVAIVASQTPIVLGAGICSAAIGPYAYVQQTQLTDIATLKETHEAVEREVNRLSAENERLGKSVAELGDTVDELEHVEQCLDVITQTQGQSVDAFAEQVAENREILARMQKNLKANILQNLLSVVIRSDGDGSMTIEEDEIDGLIKRIRDINGVLIDDKLFRRAVLENGGSLQAVMDVVKDLIAGNNDTESEIIKIAD